MPQGAKLPLLFLSTRSNPHGVPRLFGGISAEDDTGRAFAGRSAQRRRLALLALLVTAPGRCRSRDKLIGYLWPETEAEKARHVLSLAVYEIRKVLGDDALTSRGEDLYLAPDVGSDLADFEEAIASGDLERAVSVYAGPFLDGVYLSRAAEFEGWVEEEREVCARRYREALERLAVEREDASDLPGAIDAWRRLAAADPYNSRIALRLMQALHAAGNRAAALQHASLHTQRLRQEYDAEPDPEVTALAERLRTEPDAVSSTMPSTPRVAETSSDIPSEPPPQHPARGSRHRIAGRTALPIRSNRRSRRLLLAVLAVAVVLLAFWIWRALTPASPMPSIAILPFAVDSPGGAGEFTIGDALADEITTALSKLADLHVLARTSAFTFRGDSIDVREVGRRLGVSHVLQGLVRYVGERVSVTADLIDAESGFAVWSDTYTVDPSNIFPVQEEISRAVANALLPRLSSQRFIALENPTTDDSEAFRLYVLGREYWFERTLNGFTRAGDLFQQAINLDSQYVRPLVGLADLYNLLGSYDYGVLAPERAYPLARERARRALDLYPDFGEAHAALAYVYFYYDWDWDGAERQFKRALDLSPSYAPAHHWYSLFLDAMGRNTEALEQIKLAEEIDPLSLVMRTSLGRHFYFAREYDRAIQEYLRVLQQEPDFVTARLGLGLADVVSGRPEDALKQYERALTDSAPPALTTALLGHAYGRLGNRDQALLELRQLQELSTGRYVPEAYFALIYLALGDADSAFDRLARAYENRSNALVYLGVEPIADPLRDDPRFRQLLHDVGLTALSSNSP